MDADTKPPAGAPAQEGGLALRLAAYVCFGIAVGAPAAQSWTALRFLPGDSFVGQILIQPVIVIGTVALARILWAPFLDAYRPPFLRGLGRRRGWVANLLVLLALFSIAVALTLPSGSDPLANGPVYPILYALALLTAGGLLAAVDGLRSVEPDPRSHGLLAAVQYVAIVVPTMIFLLVDWRQPSSLAVLWIFIAFLAAGPLGLWLLPAAPGTAISGIRDIPRVRRFLEGEQHLSRGGRALLAWLYGVFVCPILDFFERHGPAAWLALLVLVLGDFTASASRPGRLARLFGNAIDTETFQQIGVMSGIGQFAGAFLAAFVVYRFAAVVGFAMALTVAAVGLGLSILAILSAPAALPFYATFIFDSLARGTVFIAFIAVIAHLVSPRFAAFQFSLLWICAIPNIVKTHVTNALENAAGLLGAHLVLLALLALTIGLTLQLARMLEAPSPPRG
jgi:hypothetical protein